MAKSWRVRGVLYVEDYPGATRMPVVDVVETRVGVPFRYGCISCTDLFV